MSAPTWLVELLGEHIFDDTMGYCSCGLNLATADEIGAHLAAVVWEKLQIDQETTDQSFGDIIESLKVAPTLNDGDLVAGAVVLLEVIEPDGDTRLSVAWSEGMSWLKRTGMLHHALAEENSTPVEDA